MTEKTLVRENLMTREGYSPYCGNDRCIGLWPRTIWNRHQFKCPDCGWVSEFPEDFIKRYKEKWGKQ